MGGKLNGLKPMNMKHEGVSHWFILDTLNGNRIIDITANQFKTPPDYSKARGRGFLTRLPSKRAVTLMNRIKYNRQQISISISDEYESWFYWWIGSNLPKLKILLPYDNPMSNHYECVSDMIEVD